MPRVFGRISFFVNAGVRFVEEHAKLRAMGTMWERLGRDRYGVTDERDLRFRYGVQVNSLGLTESQPENNVQRIVLEALAVTLGRNARARSVQLPAWNEALGLPRPWDQQWSLRIQQVLAFETDLLEYPDLFEGSKVMDGLVAELIDGRRGRARDRRRARRRGPRGRLHEGRARRLAPRAHPAHRGRRAGRRRRQPLRVRRALAARRGRRRRHPHGRPGAGGPAARGGRRVAREPRPGGGRRGAGRARRGRRRRRRTSWPATLAAARAGATTGEWAGDAARGVRRVPRADRRRRGGRGRRGRGPRRAARGGRAGRATRSGGGRRSSSASPASTATPTAPSRSPCARATSAWTSSTRASASRRRRSRRARSQEGVHVVGLSILSGSHRELIPLVIDALRERGVDAPVVVGGIIPEADVAAAAGRRRRRGLHAEGLRPHAHHARHRGARRRAQRGEGGGLSRPVLDLRGAVPGAAPPAAPAARGLVLSESGLEAVPGWVAKLRQLRMLDLAHNDLALVPDDLGALTASRCCTSATTASPRSRPPCARSGRCGT